MKYVIDACSLINLHNGNSLSLVSQLAGFELVVGPMVLDECGDEISKIIQREAQTSNSISIIDDTKIPAESYLELLDEHQLGEGETEALTIAITLGLMFCSDDKKARNVGSALLGDDQVLGSLRLVQCCVQQKLCACLVAYNAFLQMRELGAFLPVVKQEYFCERAAEC